MSEMSLEAPDADSVEQNLDAIPATSNADDPADLQESPLEADQADTVEQSQSVAVDDDEYR
jgi:hypothetical protein